MKALFVALVAFATVAAVMAGRSTSASFADQVMSNNNSFTAGSLTAPTLAAPTVTGTGATATVALSWDNVSFQTTFDVLRSTGTCAATDPSSPVPGGSNLPGGTTALTDIPGAAGAYCYAIRAGYQSWSQVSNEREATIGPAVTSSTLRIQPNATLWTATTPSGNVVDINSGSSRSFTGLGVASASNAADWSVVLVLRNDRPSVTTTADVSIWWQSGATCGTGPVAGQIFAQTTSALTIAGSSTNLRGVTLTIPAVGGSVSHTFSAGERLCMEIQNHGTDFSGTDAQRIGIRANTPSTSGAAGVSRVDGPLGMAPAFTATAVSLRNRDGGTVGRIETGDTIVLTFNQAVDRDSVGVCGNPAGNSGADLRLNSASPDRVQAAGSDLTFGRINLSSNSFITSDDTATNSLCAWSAGDTVLTITLADVSGTATVSSSQTGTYVPNGGIRSALGVPIDVSATPATAPGVQF